MKGPVIIVVEDLSLTPHCQVKQLSSDLVSLIGQLENDFNENDRAFQQKIKSKSAKLFDSFIYSSLSRIQGNVMSVVIRYLFIT